MYPGYLAHVVSAMLYSVVAIRRQPNLYIKIIYRIIYRIIYTEGEGGSRPLCTRRTDEIICFKPHEFQVICFEKGECSSKGLN